MVGVIACAGKSSRLFPCTTHIGKQLLPLYNKPLIYYGICTLVEAGLKKIIIVVNESDYPIYSKLLGDGSLWGIEIVLEIDHMQMGTLGSFECAEKHTNGESVLFLLGDNFCFGKNFQKIIKLGIENVKENGGAFTYALAVKNPQDYGVATFNKQKQVVLLEEKPKKPKSNKAVIGIYIYDNSCFERAKKQKISPRGELEITDLNKDYLKDNKLKIAFLNKKDIWFDVGNSKYLLKAANAVCKIEKSTPIGCIENSCLNQGFMSKENYQSQKQLLAKSDYGKLLKLL